MCFGSFFRTLAVNSVFLCFQVVVFIQLLNTCNMLFCKSQQKASKMTANKPTPNVASRVEQSVLLTALTLVRQSLNCGNDKQRVK